MIGPAFIRVVLNLGHGYMWVCWKLEYFLSSIAGRALNLLVFCLLANSTSLITISVSFLYHFNVCVWVTCSVRMSIIICVCMDGAVDTG